MATAGSGRDEDRLAALGAVRVEAHSEGWDIRRRKAEAHLIPWIQQTYPLAGRTVFEYGCGSGPVSQALAPHVARVIGVDIDPVAVEDGCAALAAHGVGNVELHHFAPERIFDEVEALDPAVDVFLLYAVLEHMTIAERLRVLEIAQRAVGTEGIIVVCELPNRLIPFDGHTAQLPFFDQLPDELALKYACFSPREEFVAAMSAAAEHGAAFSQEVLTRWGRGVSFHEFELAFGELSRRVLASNYDELLMSVRPIEREELVLASLLAEYRPDLAPVWSRYWQDFILSASPIESTPRFIRPLPLDRVRVDGQAQPAQRDVVIGSAPAEVTFPQDTDRLLVGMMVDFEALTVDVLAPSGLSTVRIEPAGRLAEPRFATVDLAAPTNIVTLLPSGPGYLMFVGYAA